MKTRNRIIAKIISKYWVGAHKFGIKIPKIVEEAKRLSDQHSRNRRKHVDNISPGYQQVKCQLIFDVKVGKNFRRKARFTAGGHTTEVSETLIVYSSVVSKDSVVCIALTIAALNDLQVMACDIQNVYLNSDCWEKIWTVAGPEFGSEPGTIFLVKKAYTD